MANYINNADLTKSLGAWADAHRAAVAAKQPVPPCPDDVAASALQIANKLIGKPNFKFYSFTEDMVGDAMLAVIKYAASFDRAKSQNGFAYLTTVVYNAFIRFITREQKQSYVVAKIIQADAGGRMKHLEE